MIQWKWYEVWADELSDGIYLLVVYRINSGEHIVIDPQDNKTIQFQELDYEKVKLWLLEDGYVKVDGRIFDDT